MHHYICHAPLSPFIIDLHDHRYSLRPPSDKVIPSSLHNSIEKFGILHPPLLQQTQDGHIVISGRKRIEAARRFKLPKIPCSILSANTSLKNTGEYLIAHARIGAELSVIERAIFFTKVVKELTMAEKISLLSLLDLKPQAFQITEMSKYMTLEEMTINGIHEGWIQPRTGLKLLHLQNKNDQEIVVQLLKKFQFGGSKQQKLVAHAIELVKRTGQPFANIIKKWQYFYEGGENKPQQGANLLNLLEKKCFPRLTAVQEQFRQFQQSLQLPGNVKLNHTESFEDNTINLSISFANQDEMLSNWRNIEKIL